MTPEDYLRTLNIAFRSGPYAASDWTPSPVLNPYKHFRAELPDGFYQIEGGGIAYEIKAQSLVRTVNAGSPSWPQEVTVIAPT